MEKKYLVLLKQVLGDDVEVIRPLVGGMMNEAYIVQNKEGKFVYYISTAQANEMVDRHLEKETQNIAFELGITSENIYFDLENGIKINRFIEGESLNHVDCFDYDKVAELLYKLHSSKKKASVYYDPLTRLENYRKEAEAFVPRFNEFFYDLFDKIMANKEFLLAQERDLAHNDAQRSNIICDLDDNYFLIDYEFAANNDPIYDIATFGNQDVYEGKRLLDTYVKLHPVNNALKRYALWRIDISLQWYLVAIVKHYRGEGAVHNINFLDVANHFINNAFEANKLLEQVK